MERTWKLRDLDSSLNCALLPCLQASHRLCESRLIYKMKRTVNIAPPVSGWQSVKWGVLMKNVEGCSCAMTMLIVKLHFVCCYKICWEHLLWQTTKQDLFIFHTVCYVKIFYVRNEEPNIGLIDGLEIDCCLFSTPFLLVLFVFSSSWFSRQRVYPAVGWKHQVFQEASERDGLHHLWEWRLPSGSFDALHAGQDWVCSVAGRTLASLDLRLPGY